MKKKKNSLSTYHNEEELDYESKYFSTDGEIDTIVSRHASKKRKRVEKKKKSRNGGSSEWSNDDDAGEEDYFSSDTSLSSQTMLTELGQLSTENISDEYEGEEEDEDEIQFDSARGRLVDVPYQKYTNSLILSMEALLASMGDISHIQLFRMNTRSICNLVVYIKYKYLRHYVHTVGNCDDPLTDIPRGGAIDHGKFDLLRYASNVLGYYDTRGTEMPLTDVLIAGPDNIIERTVVKTLQLSRVMIALEYKKLNQQLHMDVCDKTLPATIVMKAQEVVLHSRNILHSATQIHSTCTHIGASEPSDYWCFRTIMPRRCSDENFTELQSLISYMIDHIVYMGYVRHRDELWEQQYVSLRGEVHHLSKKRLTSSSTTSSTTPRRLLLLDEATKEDNDMDDVALTPTRAYKRKCTIEEYMYKHITRDTNMEQWKNMTRHGVVEHARKDLVRTEEVPQYKPHRHMHAFANGIYITKLHKFYKFSEMAMIPPEYTSRHCCSYKKEIIFDYDLLVDAAPEPEYFRDIDAGPMDAMLAYQFGEDQDTIDWFWALVVGKMLYEINEMDRWQVLPFIIGVAGSGKSTIANVIKDFYEVGDVEILSNNMERQFGLSSIDPDKDLKMFLCPEVRTDFKMPQTDFQSLVSGESIQMAAKYKNPRTVTIKTPGLFCGNRPPQWDNAARSVARRIAFFHFSKFVVESNTNYETELKSMIPSIMVKGNLAYKLMVARHGNVDIWKRVSAAMKMAQSITEAAMNPLQAFLLDKTAYKLGGPSDILPFRLFQYLVKEFADRNNIRLTSSVFDKDSLKATLVQNGLGYEEGERWYKGEALHDKYITNIILIEWAENLLERRANR